MVIFLHNISAQQRKAYIVKAGETPGEALPAEALYVFPVFIEGIVYLRDGSFSRQKFNYNILQSEMQFISTNGDTLAIADPPMIKNIIIDTVVYYYDKSYLQVISQIDSFKLAIKQRLIQLPYRTRAGYDAPSGVSSITTYGSITARGSVARLQARKDVLFEKEIVYYVSDQFSHFIRADKKAFLNMFGNKKNLIQKYMNENNINYFSKEDLQKLLTFCVYKD